jgi:hypothetical protein
MNSDGITKDSKILTNKKEICKDLQSNGRILFNNINNRSYRCNNGQDNDLELPAENKNDLKGHVYIHFH